MIAAAWTVASWRTVSRAAAQPEANLVGADSGMLA